VSTASQVALWVIVIVQSVLILGLMREVGLLQLRVGPQHAMVTSDQGLGPGTTAPDLVLEDVFTGDEVHLGSPQAHARVLAFIDPKCGICHGILGPLEILARSEKDRLDVVAVCNAAPEDCRAFLRPVTPHVFALADFSASARQHFRVTGSSFAIVVDRDGVVGDGGVVNNLQHLESLLDTLTPDGELLLADGPPSQLVS
jgi:methylamine dehydrogenase accessory protein MauD